MYMGHIFKEQMIRNCYRLENSRLLSIVRRGLSMLIPVIVFGAAAYAILNFPNDAFHAFITERYEEIGGLLEIIYRVTFGMFSLILVAALSVSYALETKESIDMVPFYLITSIASFGSQMIMADGAERVEVLGNKGCFVAMVIGLLSCFLFSRLKRISCLSLRRYTLGMEIIPANAIQSIFPAAITIGCFAAVQYAYLVASGGKSIYTLWAEGMQRMFDGMGNGFFPALLFTVLVHILWVFGFHGSHMMETVAADSFSVVGEEIIFSKSFFDTFVMMGGCGTTICVLIGIFLFSRKKRMRNIGKIALPTVLFNTNELLNFGIPIMLNPVLGIPFVCVPVLAVTLSYGATMLGIVPHVTREITWTMPIFFSGYIATGSAAGSIMQLVIVILGVAVYAPFLRMYEEIYELRMQDKIKNLTEELKECEENCETPGFLRRLDDSGMVARMLLQELRQAVQQRQLYLLYQPQVDGEGNYIGAEALLRWQHPEYGYIYPPLIICLAKEGEMPPELERMLFDMAIGGIQKVSAECGEKFKISVNITAHSLEWEIEEYIKAKLEEYHVPADRLWLEITEQDALIHSETARNKLGLLREEGHVLLIDDFGMGHTSLNYLQSEYFGVVKLDGSLVRHITDQETDRKLAASVMELGKKLGVRVIAECVETEEQQELLKELGCDWYQGYLFGKPAVLEQFIRDMQRNGRG